MACVGCGEGEVGAEGDGAAERCGAGGGEGGLAVEGEGAPEEGADDVVGGDVGG